MKEAAQTKKERFTLRSWRRGAVVAVALLAMFAVGHGTTSSFIRSCNAQVALPAGPPSTVSEDFCPCCAAPPCPGVCDGTGMTASLAGWLINNLRDALFAASRTLEIFIATQIVPQLTDTGDILRFQMNKLELDMITWWETMWHYNLKPSLQAMTRQLNADLAYQALVLHAAADATGEIEVDLALEKHGTEDRENTGPSDKACIAGTTIGGSGRANNLARAMRLAWEMESLEPGLNKRDTVGAASARAAEAERHSDFESLFCDPDGNSGKPRCAGNPAFYNADVQPTKFLYGRLTVDVDRDPNLAKTVETILNNMVGIPSADPIVTGALQYEGGQIGFMDRRSYLARYAAVRTAPQLAASWRMPGSGMGNWVRQLRSEAGVPVTNISENPSYKEVMHAISIDRFDSGMYASGLITDEAKMEQEKLTLDAFYLMQLRDYYELLERTALTLAVQVSILSGQEGLHDTAPAVPF